MILLYLFSCLYHALPPSKGKQVFQVLDHCSIFLLIMGTYAPVCLVTVGGPYGWVLFGINLACGLVGIVLNAVDLASVEETLLGTLPGHGVDGRVGHAGDAAQSQ